MPPQTDYPWNTSSYELYPQQNQGNNPYPSEQILPSVNSEEILEIPESMESIFPEKIKEMEEMIATLTAAYNSAPPFVPECLEDLAEKERAFMVRPNIIDIKSISIFWVKIHLFTHISSTHILNPLRRSDDAIDLGQDWFR